MPVTQRIPPDNTFRKASCRTLSCLGGTIPWGLCEVGWICPFRQKYVNVHCAPSQIYKIWSHQKWSNTICFIKETEMVSWNHQTMNMHLTTQNRNLEYALSMALFARKLENAWTYPANNSPSGHNSVACEDRAGSGDLDGTHRSIDGTRTWPFRGLNHRLLFSPFPFIDISKMSIFARQII